MPIQRSTGGQTKVAVLGRPEGYRCEYVLLAPPPKKKTKTRAQISVTRTRQCSVASVSMSTRYEKGRQRSLLTLMARLSVRRRRACSPDKRTPGSIAICRPACGGCTRRAERFSPCTNGQSTEKRAVIALKTPRSMRILAVMVSCFT